MRFKVRRIHAPWWHVVCTVVLVMLAVGACSPIAREGDYSRHEFTLHSGELEGEPLDAHGCEVGCDQAD